MRDPTLRMDAKTNLMIIEAYKNEECLWNTHLLDYPNKEKRKGALNRIAKLLHDPYINGKHIMNKLGNIRKYYLKESKRIAESLQTADSVNSGEVYKPTVPWFSLMDSFLGPHIQSLQPPSISTNPTVQVETSRDDDQEDWATAQKTIVVVDTSTSSSESDRFSAEDDEESNDLGPKRRSLSSASSRGRSLDRRSSSSHATPSSSVPAPPAPVAGDDVHDAFGTYIASLLRRLPPEKALEVQPEILKMIVNVGVEGVQKRV